MNFIITPFLFILSPFPQECSACSNVLNCIDVLHGGWYCSCELCGMQSMCWHPVVPLPCSSHKLDHCLFTAMVLVLDVLWCHFANYLFISSPPLSHETLLHLCLSPHPVKVRPPMVMYALCHSQTCMESFTASKSSNTCCATL